MKPYQPSNGTEGMWFTDKYCMNCIHENPDPDKEPKCSILSNSMAFSIGDPEYPKEWVFDENNCPKCLAFKKWDWGNDGDPNDFDNPNAPIPVGPNQLVMPFLIDGIPVINSIDNLYKIETTAT